MFPGMISFFGRTGLLAVATIALVFSCMAQVPAPAPPQARRLILKDGSYQSVTKYEIHGERVRYFSAERGEWEEAPKALIDWQAPDKFEHARAPRAPPGLPLPDEGGIFLLDTYQNLPQLSELQQSGTDLDKNTKSNI